MRETVSFFALFADYLSKGFWTEEKWRDSLISPPACTVSSLMRNHSDHLLQRLLHVPLGECPSD